MFIGIRYRIAAEQLLRQASGTVIFGGILVWVVVPRERQLPAKNALNYSE